LEAAFLGAVFLPAFLVALLGAVFLVDFLETFLGATFLGEEVLGAAILVAFLAKRKS
jgi:hypothetical protein